MKHFYRLALLTSLAVVPAVSQHHDSNWIHRSATDTTIVFCWNDSLSSAKFPASSMTGMMGMMYPDSLYCRIDRMNLDSLLFPHDSTFIGWCRVQAGTDTVHFSMMNAYSMYGGMNMMQFMKNVSCQFHWDSLMSDSMHRHWRPTGIKGWNGSSWVSLGSTTSGNIQVVASSQLYSAFAFIGTPSAVASVADRQAIPEEFRLEQNYPNPFNPSTTIQFNLPEADLVTLKVYDLLGKDVKTLINSPQNAGSHTVTFDASDLPSGAYFYRLEAGRYAEARKLVVLK